ncbi:hypothetical protein Tco_0481862 [Tanacetum coccineum]
MIRYLEKVRALTKFFEAFSIKQIPRSENKKADALSKIASTSFAHLSKQVLVEELKEKSISEVEILAVVEEEGDTWMTPLFKYLAEGTLPTDVKKARAIRRKSWRFAVHDPSWLKPYLAYHAQRRKDVNKSMPRLSSSQTHPKESAAKSNPNYISMLGINLDLLEERREEATIHEAKSKAKIEKYYNAKVRNTSFKPRDLVYRNNDASRAEDTGKLGPKWEGPYEVTKALGKGAYKLRDRNGSADLECQQPLEMNFNKSEA